MRMKSQEGKIWCRMSCEVYFRRLYYLGLFAIGENGSRSGTDELKTTVQKTHIFFSLERERGESRR